ncbi:hypothetical protein [Paenibacillus ehimensis]|uniref:Uncharacterized protein n=1 Tax=Paenibacillus ehimensis TaxID=79264 RepID=A0ABT8V873_9BACL|nr:hypothetical protein [Paenibacillus ehimensis]MDO3676654.1 hypothetical protein [Paenibacillus ehimensis]
MFTGVTVRDDTLSFRAYTTTKGGSTELYDAYSIKKTAVKPNKVENAKATLTADGQVKLTWNAPGTGSAVEGATAFTSRTMQWARTGRPQSVILTERPPTAIP